jgi:hypothetical protein
MAFSKYEPHRPPEGDALDASTPQAERRARFLRWANWIVLAYTALGFGFLVYWLVR